MNFLRLLKIIRVSARYRLDLLLPNKSWLIPIKITAWLNPRCWFAARLARGERLRLALETLGPIFVKFGQIISTRRDLLPDDIANELALLQDRVPPFASEQALAIVNQTYGKPANDVFADFNPEPLASASIAQVHTAKLPTGEDVVVKIVRPNIDKAIKQDVKLMYSAAKWFNRISKDAKRLRPIEVVAEFDKNLHYELDMQREGANAAQIRRSFENSDIIYVPNIYFDYTHTNILVMERIYGVRISDIDKLKAHDINLETLARNGVEIFMTQVFRDSFFHADMHPGNVLVDIHNPSRPKYCAVDFGIVGALNASDQRYLAENFLGFFERDYRRIAELHVESMWVPADTNIEDFTAAIRTVCEPIFQKPMSEISFGQVLLRLFQVAREFNMEIQPQLILLQKTLLNVEGLGRQLYPDLDLWDTVYPFLKRWVRERYSLKTMLKKIKANLPLWIEKFPELPELIYAFLTAKTDNKPQA